MKPAKKEMSGANNLVRTWALLAVTAIFVYLPVALILGGPAPAQERNQKLESVLQHAHVFAGTGGRYSVQIFEKEGFVQVTNYPFNNAAGRVKDAVAAAKALITFSPTQFTNVAVHYFDPANSGHSAEVIVTAKDITSLSVGTSTMDDLMKNARVVEVWPQESKASILDKYLSIAEKLMSDSNYWEAEQVVDSALRAVGTPSEQGRLTQDMLYLADGLDARGDLERAERVLKKVLEVRNQSGKLNDPDAERTIDHLCELYISNNHYSDAMDLLSKLMSDPNLSQLNNPAAYANNLERMGICQLKTKNYDSALTTFTQVVNLKRAQHGENSPALAMALEELGDTYKAQGKNGDAQANYKEAHAIYDHAVVNKSRTDKMDYNTYAAHVKQLDEKIRTK